GRAIHRTSLRLYYKRTVPATGTAAAPRKQTAGKTTTNDGSCRPHGNEAVWASQGRQSRGIALIWQGWRAAPSAPQQRGAIKCKKARFRPLNAAGDIAARCPYHPNHD